MSGIYEHCADKTTSQKQRLCSESLSLEFTFDCPVRVLIPRVWDIMCSFMHMHVNR